MSKIHGHGSIPSTTKLTPAERKAVEAEVKRELKAELPQIRDTFEHSKHHKHVKHHAHQGTGSAAGANATGGGGSVSGADATGGASATGTPSASNLNSGVDDLFNHLGDQESGLMGQLNQALSQTPDQNGMITIDGKKVNASAYMQKLQFQMNTVQEMLQTLSNILKTEHDGRMNTIGNIRG